MRYPSSRLKTRSSSNNVYRSWPSLCVVWWPSLLAVAELRSLIAPGQPAPSLQTAETKVTGDVSKVTPVQPYDQANLYGRYALLQSDEDRDVVGGPKFGLFATSLSQERQGDWNQQFQEALELPAATTAQKEHRNLVLTQLSTDFMSLATQYGRTIISELVDPKSQTIPPSNKLGGVAGGGMDLSQLVHGVHNSRAVKFVVNGILFVST